MRNAIEGNHYKGVWRHASPRKLTKIPSKFPALKIELYEEQHISSNENKSCDLVDKNFKN